jgi:hypothetical protein
MRAKLRTHVEELTHRTEKVRFPDRAGRCGTPGPLATPQAGPGAVVIVAFRLARRGSARR